MSGSPVQGSVRTEPRWIVCPFIIGALGVGGQVRRARVVEHDDRRRAPFPGELDLVAAEVPAVARDHDLSRY